MEQPSARQAPVLVVGAGAAGLVAALAAAKGRARVVVLEKAPPAGAAAPAAAELESNTARSTGLIPAAATSLQRAAGILDDSPERLAEDILHENGGSAEPLVRRAAAAATGTVEWLASLLPPGALVCATDFLYPGHSRLRMHGPPAGYGRRLQQDLLEAAEAEPLVEVRRGADVQSLSSVRLPDGRTAVTGLRLQDGSLLEGAAVVLATNGFGASRELVARHLGEGVASGLYLGSPLNTGDGIAWAEAVGAATERMGSYQGHASVAAPEGPLVTWGVVVNGGVLLDRRGKRFGNELVGYSAYSESVMAQPGAEAVEVFSHACYEACRGTRLEEVIEAGKVGTFDSLAALCEAHRLPLATVRETIEEVRRASGHKDSLGRPWPAENSWSSSDGPLHAIAVRAALFHTQGGLRTDFDARVLRSDGVPIPGLFAVGGAAAGLSGEGASGYLSGNGLLHAVVSGRWAGEAASAATTGAAAVSAL